MEQEQEQEQEAKLSSSLLYVVFIGSYYYSLKGPTCCWNDILRSETRVAGFVVFQRLRLYKYASIFSICSWQASSGRST